MVAFVFFAAMTLYSAWRVATAPLLTHAALFLAATFAGVAGVFFLLQADFLAAVQLLLYAGAVMTVVIFAIMLSETEMSEQGGKGWAGQMRSSQFGWVPFFGALALLVLLCVVYLRGAAGWPSRPLPAAPNSTTFIAHALFSVYALPFEVASILLLAAMVGAIVLTRAEGGAK